MTSIHSLARPRSREVARSSRESDRRIASKELEGEPAGNCGSGLSHIGLDHPKIPAAPTGWIRSLFYCSSTMLHAVAKAVALLELLFPSYRVPNDRRQVIVRRRPT